jgi:hypothetical protein
MISSRCGVSQKEVIQLDKEALFSKVSQWFEQTGLMATRVDDPQADFHFVASEPNLPPVEILHPKAESEYIVFAARVILPEDLQKKYVGLSPEKRRKLVSEIRLRLLVMSLEFRIIGMETQIPTAFELYSRIFVEGGDPNRFWDTYVKIKSGLTLIISLFQDFLQA